MGLVLKPDLSEDAVMATELSMGGGQTGARHAGLLRVVFSYGVAVLSVGISLGIKVAFDYFNEPFPFTACSIIAIIITAWYCGAGPGFLAVGLSFLATALIPALVLSRSHLVYHGLSSLLVLWIGASRAHQLPGRADAELEQKVEARTRELAATNAALRTEIAQRKLVEESRRLLDDSIRLAIDTIPTMAWTLWPDGSIEFVNQRWLDYSGLSLEQERADPAGPIHPGDRERVLENWRGALVQELPLEDEMRLRRGDGEYRWFLVRTVPLRDAQGNIIRWYGSSMDIDDRKQAETQWRVLIDAIPHQIWSGSSDGTLDYCNERWRTYMGLEEEDLRGDGWQSMLHPEDRERVLKAWRESVTKGAPYKQEERHRGSDGKFRWFLSLGVPLRDGEGRIVRWYGTNTDIEDHKRAEEALKVQALRFKTLMETSPDSIYVLNEKGDLQQANAAFLSRRGYTVAEVEGLNVADWDAKWTREELQEKMDEMIDGSAVFETRHRCKDGSIFDAEVSATGVRIAGEKLFFCVTRDVTERKRAEERLQEYERVVEGLEEMIVVVDRDYRYLLANRAFLNYRGLERDQVIGRLVSDVLSPEAFTKVAAKLSDCLAGKAIQYEMRYPYPDRGERDLLISYFPIEGPEGIDRVACVLHDITERKESEERLRRSEEKFKALFELAPVGIAFLDSGLNIVDCNPALERITRLSREELRGGAWQRRTFLNADGSPRPPGERVTERAVNEKRLVSGVETGAVMEGGDIVWAEVSVAPLALPDARAVVVMQDITDRKRAAEQLEEANRQLRILSRQLFQVQEEERRHLARELHDEIGQTLTAAKINLKIIAPDAPARISGRLDDSIQLLDHLLAQVRQLSLDLRPSVLDDLGLVPALRSLADQQGRRASVAVRFSAEHIPESLDPEIQTTCFRIAQEGITNAVRHANPTHIKIDLRGGDGKLRLLIQDDGIGFEMDSARAKTGGLGLMGMQERAALVGGGAKIISSPGRGTTIEVSLPLADRGARAGGS